VGGPSRAPTSRQREHPSQGEDKLGLPFHAGTALPHACYHTPPRLPFTGRLPFWAASHSLTASWVPTPPANTSDKHFFSLQWLEGI